MLDLSEEPLENRNLCRLPQAYAKLGMTLKSEWAGEVKKMAWITLESTTPQLYTQPEDVAYAYEHLMKSAHDSPSRRRSVTYTAFTNPGNVKLDSVILDNSRNTCLRNSESRPRRWTSFSMDLATQAEIREAISYGVIKMNIDTDTVGDLGRVMKYKAKEGYLGRSVTLKVTSQQEILRPTCGCVKVKIPLFSGCSRRLKTLTA